MPAPNVLETGRTYSVMVRFEYLSPDGVTWEVKAGDRLTILVRRPDGYRVRAGGLTFNLSAAMLARVTATSEGK